MGGPDGTALRLDISIEDHARLSVSTIQAYGYRYCRAAGAWSVGFGWKDGVLVAKTAQKELRHANNKPLVEITEGRWREDNGEHAGFIDRGIIRQLFK